MNKINQMGFTLIEVLVALMILAIALSAMIKISTESVDDGSYLQNKTFAHWVGANIIAEKQTGLISKDKNQGQTKMANQIWYWKSKTDTSPIPDTNQISILVSKNPTGPTVDTIVGFV